MTKLTFLKLKDVYYKLNKYGSISYFGKKEKTRVNPKIKLPFLVDQKINKKEIQLN